MTERKLTPDIATKDEIEAIKGAYRGNGNTMFEQAVKRGTDASNADKAASNIAGVIQGLAVTEESPIPPEEPKIEEPKIEVKPIELSDSAKEHKKIVDEIKARESNKVPEVKAPVAPTPVTFKFTKEYITDAKAAVAELKSLLGNEKFAELEPRIEKGLASDNFVKNAKGGYDAKANVFDIALKAQGFIGVPTQEEKEERVAEVRSAAKVEPSPVIDLANDGKKTQKDYMKDLKKGSPNQKREALYKLIGVDETADQLKGMIGRK